LGDTSVFHFGFFQKENASHGPAQAFSPGH